MAFTDDEKKELREVYADATLDALKRYDSERAEYEAKVAAQNGGNGNGGNGNGNDNDHKPAPSFAERLLGGSKRS